MELLGSLCRWSETDPDLCALWMIQHHRVMDSPSATARLPPKLVLANLRVMTEFLSHGHQRSNPITPLHEDAKSRGYPTHT